ncbi:MAG: hypothetical protein K6F89_06315 [Prevotella sp.]|nr:hypothetical protein [Prevotella sp.]
MIKSKTSLSSGETLAKILAITSNNNVYEATPSEIGGLGLFTDMAKGGFGFGTCSTAATTVAKTVTISNFLLIKNCFIAVRFTYAVKIADATLNVSGTGAKPLWIDGAALQPGVIRPNMTAILQYDGTHWNIASLMGLEQSQGDDDELYVDMGLPSGLLWAKKNIDLTQDNHFAASEYQYECSFFSWGNTQGHNPNAQNTFADVYDWGTANDGPYASTPGAALTGNISPSFDAARVNLGTPWRMPNTNEYKELFDNIDYIDSGGATIDSTTADKRTTVDGIVGLRIKSKLNGNILFFPASGGGSGTSWNSRGSYGLYWASSLYSATNGRLLIFYSGGVNPQYCNIRFDGFAVRPVQ